MKKRKDDQKIEVFVSSGNIFADLGYANPEEALAKSELAEQIYAIIKSRKLTQKRAAEIMGGVNTQSTLCLRRWYSRLFHHGVL